MSVSSLLQENAFDIKCSTVSTKYDDNPAGSANVSVLGTSQKNLYFGTESINDDKRGYLISCACTNAPTDFGLRFYGRDNSGNIDTTSAPLTVYGTGASTTGYYENLPYVEMPFLKVDGNASVLNLLPGSVNGFGGTFSLGTAEHPFTNAFVQNYPNVVSDMRKKQDVADLHQGLGFVSRLRPVSFRLKNDTKMEHWGFIAQEICQALDDAGHDPENHELTRVGDEKKPYTISPGVLIPVLVKSIQELSARIERLENPTVASRVSAIETKPSPSPQGGSRWVE